MPPEECPHPPGTEAYANWWENHFRTNAVPAALKKLARQHEIREQFDRLTRRDVLIHAAMTEARMGNLVSEDALKLIVVLLVEKCNGLSAQLVEVLERTGPTFILSKQTPKE